MLDYKTEEYHDYKREILNLTPITPEKAASYREIWQRYHGKNAFTGEDKTIK